MSGPHSSVLSTPSPSLLPHRLRVLIDTALLSSLSTNNSKLVLMFSHLALGGIYVNRTDHTHILAIISMEANGATDVVIEEGGGSEEREGGSVEVEVDGELEGPVQVSIFPIITVTILTAVIFDR